MPPLRRVVAGISRVLLREFLRLPTQHQGGRRASIWMETPGSDLGEVNGFLSALSLTYR
jgi:hypothetical protein